MRRVLLQQPGHVPWIERHVPRPLPGPVPFGAVAFFVVFFARFVVFFFAIPRSWMGGACLHRIYRVSAAGSGERWLTDRSFPLGFLM